jgi:hypothetical protein
VIVGLAPAFVTKIKPLSLSYTRALCLQLNLGSSQTFPCACVLFSRKHWKVFFFQKISSRPGPSAHHPTPLKHSFLMLLPLDIEVQKDEKQNV